MNRLLLFAAVVLMAATLSASDPLPSNGSPVISGYPRVIRYSGKMSASDATNRTIGVTFALYENQTGGSPLWVETQNVNVDATGSFTALVGQNSLEGIPVDLFASNTAHWLGVTFENETEQPRVLLVSVPYALKAGDAETVGGFTPSQIAAMAQPLITVQNALTTTPSDGGVTLNRPGVPSRSSGSGSSPSQQRASFYMNGSSQGVIEAYDDGAASPLQLLLNPRGGNIGVNTTTPNSPLSVAGTVESTTGGFKFPDGSLQATAAFVKSFNGRTGAIVPATNDYALNQISGTLSDSQFSGTYSGAVALSNALNSFAGTFVGNGSGLTGVIPSPGSPNYVQNGTTPQSSASFNIDGSGTLGGTLAANAVNSAAGYQIGGTQVLSASAGLFNLFGGLGAGAANTTGFNNMFSGASAGVANTTGSNNTFSGYNAGAANISGTNNTYLGSNAGLSNNGSQNIYVGDSAGAVPTAESNTMRLGSASEINTTYVAGVIGTMLTSGTLVYIDPNGKLGTGGTVTGPVTSFNGRGGAVVSASGDYSFAQLSGTLGDSQFTGTYSGTVALSNALNSFAGTFVGNGSGLTGVVPSAGSPNYVQNGTSQQTGASFNIDGTATVAGLVTGGQINSTGNYQIGGATVLASSASNLFVGTGAGGSNTSGTGNAFSGPNAGFSNTSGQANTYAGGSAGYTNATGNDNTYLGNNAGFNNTGTANVYVGYNAGQSVTAESNTMRLGSPATDGTGITSTYVAGVNGATLGSGSIVYVDANGKLGTGGTVSAPVSSFNGRSGAVVPATNDYGFSQLSGSLGSTQLGGTYSGAVTLSNASNSFTGNGAGLTNVPPASGSTNYIQNQTATSQPASFKLSGNGTVSGTLTSGFVNVTSNYKIAGTTVLSESAGNLFIGPSTGGATTTGYGNTFVGSTTGSVNTTGAYNTFAGLASGDANTVGDDNTFVGAISGASNTLGGHNTFVGSNAGASNLDVDNNTYVGYYAGLATTGGANSFFGASTGLQTTSGQGNTFFGTNSGPNNTTGSYNILLGNTAGYGINAGSWNIDIGNEVIGASDESYVIRIGQPYASDASCYPNPSPCGESAAYIAGIYGATVDTNGIPVVVDDNGQLGTIVSSARFKEEVQDMADSSDALLKLRPVTFYYKRAYDHSSRRLLQYGLIAEEVAKVYPDLVAYDKEGKPFTVKYQYLTPMLLNEVEKQQSTIQHQQDVIDSQSQQIQDLRNQNEEIQKRLARIEALLTRSGD